MAQAYLSKRCRHCGKPMVQATAPVDKHDSRDLNCVDCDEIDPSELRANIGWIEGELRPPR
jgi:hypothetical protein